MNQTIKQTTITVTEVIHSPKEINYLVTFQVLKPSYVVSTVVIRARRKSSPKEAVKGAATYLVNELYPSYKIIEVLSVVPEFIN